MIKKSVSDNKKKAKFHESHERGLSTVRKQQLGSRRMPTPKANGIQENEQFSLKKKKKSNRNIY